MAHSQSYRRILHKMGYYDYQQGLIHHHLNQDGGWDDHHEHCRSFILKAVELCKPEKITVLGSGWLLDLPFAEMVEKTGKVTLVDIVHPPQVITQVSGIKKVELVEQDITGGLIEEVWKKAGKRIFLNKLTSLDEIFIPEYHTIDDPGMVISLNILTQLEALPEKLLRRKSKASEDEFRHFRKEIQKKHIAFLEKQKSVLITDVVEIITDAHGITTEQVTIATTIPKGKVKEEWIWNFDLLKSDYNRKRSVFKIIGVVI